MRKPNAGVFNSFKLADSTYTANNPVRYVDPSGNATVNTDENSYNSLHDKVREFAGQDIFLDKTEKFFLE